MTFSENPAQSTEDLLEERDRRIEELENTVAELTAQLTTIRETEEAKLQSKTLRKLSAYKVGDFVSILRPQYTEPVNGRVVEVIQGGGAVAVATASGEVTIGSPELIRKQSDKW